MFLFKKFRKISFLIASLAILTTALTVQTCSAGQDKNARDQRVLEGNATVEDLRGLTEDAQNGSTIINNLGSDSDYAFILPVTGKLSVSLADNNAGYRSELYAVIGGRTEKLFDDTRLGPLDKATEFAFLANTTVQFYITTETPQGSYTFYATGSNGKIEQTGSQKWRVSFEDIPEGVAGLPTPDWDYNDVVIDVQVTTDNYLDLSSHLQVSIDYLDHHGYNEEGYVIYYIGETVKYRVNIQVTSNHEYFAGRKFTVYALHEYFADYSYDRWYYPTPPRPANEPSFLSVKKGDLLPNQETPMSWPNQDFAEGLSLALQGQLAGSLAVVPVNDQTHIIIVSQNPQGQIETVIYDNPTAGVFDPPLR